VLYVAPLQCSLGAAAVGLNRMNSGMYVSLTGFGFFAGVGVSTAALSLGVAAFLVGVLPLGSFDVEADDAFCDATSAAAVVFFADAAE
jgi:hypothetical protein